MLVAVLSAGTFSQAQAQAQVQYPRSVSIASDESEVTIGQGQAMVTATADYDLHSGYTIVLFEHKTGSSSRCDYGRTCTMQTSISWPDGPNSTPATYHAELRNSVDARVAQTGTLSITVNDFPWTLETEVEPGTAKVGEDYPMITARVNQHLAGTGYVMQIVNATTGAVEAACDWNELCGMQTGPDFLSSPHPSAMKYFARIAKDSQVVKQDAVRTIPIDSRFRTRLSFSARESSEGQSATWLAKPEAEPNYTGLLNLQIEDSDGEVYGCGYDWASCETRLPEGATYRAVVRDGQNRVFGSSPFYRLGGNGPEEQASDMDVEALAAFLAQRMTVAELCDRMLTIPIKTNVMQPPSSLPDQYRACAAVAAAGGSMLAAVKAIAEWAVDTGIDDLGPFGPTVTEPPPGEPPPYPTTPGGPTTANPGPLPSVLRLSEIKAGLIARNVGITAAVAATAAEWCTRRMAASGLNPFQLCQRLPLFFSGRDVAEATDHDIDALIPPLGHPRWARLTYKRKGPRPNPGWYEKLNETGGTRPCKKPDDQPQLSCDEYPFWATAQGGPDADPKPHLRLISNSDNINQGSRYGAFVNSCRMAARLTASPKWGGGRFLAIPLPASTGLDTFRVCNGNPP